MKNNMFEQERFDDHDSDEDDDKDLFSRVINAPTKTLLRATAGFVLAATVLIGMYFAWKNKVWESKYLKIELCLIYV